MLQYARPHVSAQKIPELRDQILSLLPLLLKLQPALGSDLHEASSRVLTDVVRVRSTPILYESLG